MERLLTDRQGRRITYLRMSVTDRCNLRCRYCMPPEGRPWIPHEGILRYEELIRVARILAAHGVEKIRLTGGEPLVRKQLTFLIRALRALPGIREVTLTTNGVLLAEQADMLKEAGIERINVSLDSLKPEIFRTITGRDRLHAVLAGIEAARRSGMDPVKINVVPMAGVNADEVEALAALSFEAGIHVRFIEEMPIGMAGRPDAAPFAMDQVRKRVEARWGTLLPVLPSGMPDGPARRFRIPGARGEVGFIAAMSRHFCASCNRIRLTAAGDIRPCLMDDDSLSLKTALRQGADDAALYGLIEKALMRKGLAHVALPKVRTRMASIGG